MTLREIFEHKDFTRYREKELSNSDKQYFLERLEKGNRIYDVLPYLSVIKKSPIEFLEPIVDEAIDYKDVSEPKTWMQTINRLYTPEKVQETILNKIKLTQSFKIKCKATGILYCVGGFTSASGRDENGNVKWKGGHGYKWNGKRFETIIIEENLNRDLERRKKFYNERVKSLTEEFLNNENIVYRFYLKRYLPIKIEDYPTEIKEKAKKVIHFILSEEFPNGLNQTNQLKNLVKGNSELEKLLFEDLNWRKK